MIYGEVLRLARVPGETKLLTLARLGFLHVLVAAHVADEIDEHLEEWSLARGIDHAAAHERWINDLRPVLTVVTLSSDTVTELVTPGEAARLTILAESDDPKFGDPDDVPTAALALLLQAPPSVKTVHPSGLCTGQPQIRRCTPATSKLSQPVDNSTSPGKSRPAVP